MPLIHQMLLLQWQDFPAEKAEIRGKELPNTPRAGKGGPAWDMHRVATWERDVKEDLALAFPQVIGNKRS